jgi:peptide/nickel transport system substrate-binding protein
VEIVDDHNVNIVLKELRADFIYDLSLWGTIQLSPTAAEKLGEKFATNPVGTGPFKFSAYEPDSHIEMARFDEYWGGAPALDGVRVRIIPEATVKVTEMDAKSVDIAYDLTPKDVEAVKKAGATVENRTTPGAALISLNVTQAPTSELAVRRAIARAIDRDTIMNKVLFGLPEKARDGAPKGSPFYSEDVPMVEYNPEEAARILDDAGWTLGPEGIRQREGKPLSLRIISTDNLGWGVFNQVFQDQLRSVGIDSNISTEEWGTYLDNWRENKGEWNLSYHQQGSLLNSTSPINASWAPSAFWNICQIRRSTDPEMKRISEQLEAIYQEFLKTRDLQKRKELARQAQTIYQDQQLTVWLWHSPALVGVQPRLKNYDVLAHGRVVGLKKASLDG